jgi:hypothetical protein
MATKKFNVSGGTGTFNGITATSQVSGNAVFIGNDVQRAQALSALCVLLAETNTLTLTVKWQVSNDNTTFYDCAFSIGNAAATVVGTGTAGADTAVTKVFEAPQAVYGWKYARVAFVVGVATGAAGDTYTYGYNYLQGDI